jgi:hypothetical protein
MSAGYFRGKVDMLAVGFIDILLAFPSLVLALTFTAYLGQSLFNVTLALGILSIPAAARVARANTLAWANRDFVLAARTIGASDWRILTREILPNLLPPMFAFWLVAISVIIVAEGALLRAVDGVSFTLAAAARWVSSASRDRASPCWREASSACCRQTARSSLRVGSSSPGATCARRPRSRCAKSVGARSR